MTTRPAATSAAALTDPRRVGEGSRRPAMVLVVPDYVPSLGGTTTQTRLHARELARRGWGVTVVTRRTPEGGGHDEVDGIPVRRVGPPGRGNLAKGLMLASLWWWLLRRRRSVAVVSVIMDADFTLCSWLAGLGPRTVHTWVTLGDATRALAGRKAAIRRSALQRSRQVVLSEAMRDELAGLGFPDPAVIAVPVDLARYRAPSDAERLGARASLGLGTGTVVLSVSHLQERKGTDRLLAAVSALLDQGVLLTLVLVGGPVETVDRDFVERLERFVADRSLSEAVRFEGPKTDVLPYLFSADLFCLASHREGMPNVLLEAMACGVPCVAPKSAGGDALLGNGLGSVPASNDPDDLAEAIGHLVAAPADARRMGEQAREAVNRGHSIGLVIDQYEALIGARTALRPDAREAMNDEERDTASERQ